MAGNETITTAHGQWFFRLVHLGIGEVVFPALQLSLAITHGAARRDALHVGHRHAAILIKVVASATMTIHGNVVGRKLRQGRFHTAPITLCHVVRVHHTGARCVDVDMIAHNTKR